jgi:hypothetical protein
VIPATAEAVLWLGDAPAPRWEAGPVPLLQIADSTATPSVIEPLSGLPVQRLAGTDVRLAAPLAPEPLPAVLDPDFPQRLHHLLFQRFPQPDMAPAEAVRPQVDPTRLAPEPLPLQPWLALLAALLFLVERWLASGRRRFVAAQ